ncbi:hypothetical protein BY458DRAFT_548591 [Sporodiniella umbellata]|nr:hypothetical protein BY458DRAFT_548591 [Sporodiniella umbellata]
MRKIGIPTLCMVQCFQQAMSQPIKIDVAGQRKMMSQGNQNRCRCPIKINFIFSEIEIVIFRNHVTCLDSQFNNLCRVSEVLQDFAIVLHMLENGSHVNCEQMPWLSNVDAPINF